MARAAPTVTERFEIGAFTYTSPDLKLRTWRPEERITIGKYCSIADRVIICAGGQHRTDLASTYPFDTAFLGRKDNDRVYRTTRETRIGHDVWIGSGALITGGVRIGDGAVIAAQAVVFSDVPAYAIVAGNPAQLLRYRFSSPAIERLQRIAWWDWSPETVRANLDWFQRPIHEFLDRFDPLPETPRP